MTTKKQAIICGIIGALAFVPAGIVAYVNQPKDPILFQEETPVVVRDLPVMDMMHFYAVPPISSSSTPKVASFHKPKPDKQWVCGDYRDLTQGTGKVQTCEWR